MQAEKFLKLLFPELQTYDVGASQGFVRRDADAPYEPAGEGLPLGADDPRADGDAGDGVANPILRLLFPELQVWDAGVAYGFMGGKTPQPSANEQGYASAEDVLEGEPEGPLSDEARVRKEAAAAEKRSRRHSRRASARDSSADDLSEVAASLSPGYLSSEERKAALQRGSEKSQSWTDEQARAYVKAQAQASAAAKAEAAGTADAGDAGDDAASVSDAAGSAPDVPEPVPEEAESFAEARARRAGKDDSDDDEGNE